MGRKEANLTNEEIVERVKERKYKRARGVARARWLKNLGWWFFGVISSFFILFGVVAVFVGALPINSIINFATKKEDNTDILSEDILNSSVLSATMNATNYTIGDLPVVKNAILSLSPEYSTFEKGSSFDPTKQGSRLQNLYVLVDGEYVRAFDDDANYVAPANENSQLYLYNPDNFGSTLFEYTPTTLDRSQDFVATLYYYKDADGKYLRALDDSGNFVTGVTETTQLYLVDLDDVPFKDIASVALNRIMNLQLTQIMNGAGFGAFLETEDTEGVYRPTFLKDFLGDTTVLGIADINLFEKINTIKLSFILPVDSNETMYQILVDAVNGNVAEDKKVTAESLTIGDLNGNLNNFDGVRLSGILDAEDPSNDDMYNVLLDVANYPTGTLTKETITVGDIQGINLDYVKLCTVMDPSSADNKEFFEILVDAVNNKTTPAGTKDAYDLRIIDLKGIKAGNIKLATVLELPTTANNNKNEKIYDILETATGKSKSEMMVSDLSTFNTDEIKLVSVLPYSSSNTKLYDILMDVSGVTDKDELKLGDISNFNTNEIHLTSIIEAPTAENGNKNQMLYDILRDATHVDDNADINLGHLDGFDSSDVKFVSLLPVSSSNEKLYQVLEDATGKTTDEMTVNCLNSFTVGDIKLSTVIESSDNAIIKQLLSDSDPATIGNISTKIDNLDFGTVYGVDCFETYVSGSSARYSKDGDNYVLDENGEYQISKGAGIWLFLLYDSPSVDNDGNATAYNRKSLKVSDMTDNISAMSTSIKGATVRQFIDAGVLEGNANYSEDLLKLPIVDVIDTLNDFFVSDS